MCDTMNVTCTIEAAVEFIFYHIHLQRFLHTIGSNLSANSLNFSHADISASAMNTQAQFDIIWRECLPVSLEDICSFYPHRPTVTRIELEKGFKNI